LKLLNEARESTERMILSMQLGDVSAAFADTTALEACSGFLPNSLMRKGVAPFLAWYREFYGV